MDRKTLFGCLSIVVLSLTGCGCSRQRPLVVGSKNFTEQVLLGEIIAQHLENRLHQQVERKLNLGGTMLAHEALMTNEISMYPEYTGTAFTNILKFSGVNDPVVVLDRVRAGYASGMNVVWLDPLGFNNTFAMAVLGSEARARHLATLSDAAADPAGFELGAGYEFVQRPDGFSSLNAAYPIHWQNPPKTMDLGLLYTALTQMKVSMIAGSSTDGALTNTDIKVLADDKQAFPPYQACIAVRTDALAAYPDLQKILSELSGKIPDATMRQMNYAVDIKHRQVSEVAKEFLQKAGLQ